jgi:hypothetical protein
MAMGKSKSELYVESIKNIKRKNELHPQVEARLSTLLTKIYPEDCPVSEVSGIPGGRNDLILFSFTGRRIVFELFFSPYQVSQDLRLLELSNADIKIAVLLDDEVNPKLSAEYFHKKPDHFPYLWLKWLMDPDWESICLQRLRELIDEQAVIVQMRSLLSSPAGETIEKHFKGQIRQIKEKLEKQEKPSVNVKNLSGYQIASLLIIQEFRKMGIPIERLRSLHAWLQKAIPYGFQVSACGFQVFLMSDLNGRHAIRSDGDFAEDLIICGAGKNANIVLCINPIIDKINEAVGIEKKEIQFHFFHVYEENIEKIIPKVKVPPLK